MTDIAAKNVSMRELATHLRRERETAGLTQTQVASIGGVTQCVYAGIELGNKPLTVHRAADYGDTAILGAVKFLLGQLKGARHELVRASDERMCAASMVTLATLVRKSSQAVQAFAEAIEDGELSITEMERMDRELSELEDVTRQTRRDLAVRVELEKRARRESAVGLQKIRTGSVAEAKAAKVG